MIKPRSKPHSSDLRKGRVSEPGRIYHIRTSVEPRRPLFTDLLLGREVVGTLRFQHERGHVESLAFVLMPDHLHWLIRLGDSASLAQIVRSVKSFSAHRINARLGTTGQVWQDGYFDRALRAEDDIKCIARYIVANPLRARICARVADYPLWDAIWV